MFKVIIVEDVDIQQQGILWAVNEHDLLTPYYPENRRELELITNSKKLLKIISDYSKTNKLEELIVIFDVIFANHTETGISLFKKAKEKYPDVRYIAYTVSNDYSDIRQLNDADVDAIVSKDEGKNELLAAINNVIRGKKFFSNKIMQIILELAKTSYPKLTPREIEVLKIVETNPKVKYIAGKLNISESTVENHRHHIITKLEAKNIHEALNKAKKAGLI